MKLGLPTAILLAGTVCLWDVAESKKVAPTVRGKALKKLISKSTRRLEEEEEVEEDAFLLDYKLKFVKCAAGEKWQGEEGYEYSSVIYRLCPSSGECSSDEDDHFGCDEGYGDFIVGINTYVDAYAETLNEERRRKLEEEEEFRLEEYAKCEEADFPEQDDGERRRKRRRLEEDAEEEEAVYYIGPACTEDGLDIKLGLFEDYTCTTEPEEVTYYDLSGGASLEYNSGGLGSDYCYPCAVANDDGEYEAAEFCGELYEWSGKCEAGMETYSPYGQNNNQCENIAELTADLIPSGGGGAIIWILLVLVVLGGAAFFGVRRKKPDGSSASGYGQMA